MKNRLFLCFHNINEWGYFRKVKAPFFMHFRMEIGAFFEDNYENGQLKGRFIFSF